MISFVSKSEKDTAKFAKIIAKKVSAGSLILLNGDLGAGKTTFTKYFCKALKVKADVLSPTFVLERIYEGKFTIHHYDLYRLEDISQVLDLGILENLDAGDVCLVEWPDVARKMLPENCIEINITKLGESVRQFDVEGL